MPSLDQMRGHRTGRCRSPSPSRRPMRSPLRGPNLPLDGVFVGIEQILTAVAAMGETLAAGRSDPQQTRRRRAYA